MTFHQHFLAFERQSRNPDLKRHFSTNALEQALVESFFLSPILRDSCRAEKMRWWKWSEFETFYVTGSDGGGQMEVIGWR